MLPLFVGDYLAATQLFSLAEHGAYLKLLFAQWEMGPLPNDPTRLARLLGCGQEEFGHVWQTVKGKFAETEAGLVNLRLEEHRAKALDLSAKRADIGRIGGKASGESRRSKQGSNAEAIGKAIAEANWQAKSNHPSLSPSPSGSPSTAVLEDSHSQETRASAAEIREALERIKATYPKGIYRQADWILAEREIRSRIDEGAEAAALIAGCERYAAQAEAKGSVGTQYVTSPSRFFRERQYLEPFPLPAKPMTATEQLLRNLHTPAPTVAEMEADIAAGLRDESGTWIGGPRKTARTWRPPDEEEPASTGRVIEHDDSPRAPPPTAEARAARREQLKSLCSDLATRKALP